MAVIRDLKALRRACGLSQYALARNAKVLRWKLAFFETGRRVVFSEAETMRILETLAKAMGRNFEIANKSFCIGN